jgi:FtsP/CotA-like multicopper oxidase with cupredoxin domain
MWLSFGSNKVGVRWRWGFLFFADSTFIRHPGSGFPGVIPEQSGSWTLRHVGLLCLLCVIGASSCVGQDAVTRVGPNSGSAIVRTDLKIGHYPAGGCVRPAEGAEVGEPEDLRSVDGELKVDLAFRSYIGAKGERRYCYVTVNGGVSPTLRAKPGDTVILNFKNEAAAEPEGAGRAARTGAAATVAPHGGMNMSGGAGGTTEDSCANGAMKPASTNLHFHGLTVPAVCHQDDVLHTLIQPGDPAFEYRFQIPPDEPPGLYWYHPHIHGFTKTQVLGGASGALIVEGIERALPELAGIPERVLVIRDQNLLNPTATPSTDAGKALPPVVLDADGDVMNTGTGTGKPAEDLTLNFVPVPYPDYPPATITMKPGERQLWRVLNASAITYLSLQLLFDGKAQAVEVVALDGVPMHDRGAGGNRFILLSHLGVPPGGRIEFVVRGPSQGSHASLVTRSVNTGAVGENDPTRPIATIIGRPDAPEPRSILGKSPVPLPPSGTTWLRDVAPTTIRKLYFTETPLDPHDPNSPTTFYLTVDGQAPKPFDPASNVPNIVTHQGDVEDWIIENRTQELHAFHIHQVHFALLEFFGLAVNEPFLRDTVNVPYWDGKNAVYPRVKLRVDFRSPNSVGLFPYHCHLLEHEDSGMMGLIRVEPEVPAK